MANRGRATFAKRQKEIARQERAREKANRRAERKDTKGHVNRGGPVDPDIADIVPGPQPLPYEVLEDDVEIDPEAFDDEESEEEASDRR